MTSGRFKCFICKKIKECKQESIIKKDTGRITEYTKNPIYEHSCLSCLDNIKPIGEDWIKVYRGTMIYVKEDYSYRGLDLKEDTLKRGVYYICGFWGDGMGLSKTKESHNDCVIPSAALQNFYKVIQ